MFKTGRDKVDKMLIVNSIEEYKERKARKALQQKLSAQEIEDFVELDSSRYNFRKRNAKAQGGTAGRNATQPRHQSPKPFERMSSRDAANDYSLENGNKVGFSSFFASKIHRQYELDSQKQLLHLLSKSKTRQGSPVGSSARLQSIQQSVRALLEQDINKCSSISITRVNRDASPQGKQAFEFPAEARSFESLRRKEEWEEQHKKGLYKLGSERDDIYVSEHDATVFHKRGETMGSITIPVVGSWNAKTVNGRSDLVDRLSRREDLILEQTSVSDMVKGIKNEEIMQPNFRTGQIEKQNHLDVIKEDQEFRKSIVLQSLS